MELTVIAQPLKMLGVPPDLPKGLPGNVAAVEVEKSAGLHDSAMGNEAETRASQATPGNGIQAVGFESDALAVFTGALS